MEGLTTNKIAQLLMKKGIPAPGGGEKWYNGTIESILTNEKYKGSALLQKKFTVDFLTKKQKVNEGEVPQYFVENHSPADYPQRNLNWCRLKSQEERQSAEFTAAAIFFQQKLYAPAAADFTVQKYGILLTNTAV